MVVAKTTNMVARVVPIPFVFLIASSSLCDRVVSWSRDWVFPFSFPLFLPSFCRVYVPSKTALHEGDSAAALVALVVAPLTLPVAGYGSAPSREMYPSFFSPFLSTSSAPPGPFLSHSLIGSTGSSSYTTRTLDPCFFFLLVRLAR